MVIDRVADFLHNRNAEKGTEVDREEYVWSIKTGLKFKDIDILRDCLEMLVADGTDEMEELGHELADLWGMDFRVCDMCGDIMFDGYVRDGGWIYYCSEKCLYTDFDEEGWEKECESNEESYWTQWY